MADDVTKNPAPPAPRPAPPAPAIAGKAVLVEAVVAPRRTVLAPSDEKTVVGYADDGTPKMRPVDKEFRSGATVRLPEGEIKHLRRAGFLVDPDAKAIPVGTGPTFRNDP